MLNKKEKPSTEECPLISIIALDELMRLIEKVSTSPEKNKQKEIDEIITLTEELYFLGWLSDKLIHALLNLLGADVCPRQIETVDNGHIYGLVAKKLKEIFEQNDMKTLAMLFPEIERMGWAISD